LAAGSRLIADQLADDPVDIRVNGKLFGRGRIVMIDEQYGVQLTEITS
jgi:flagellar motor switch protein FliN/FliY